MNLLADRLSPSSGELVRNSRLKVGHYNQHVVERIPADETPVAYLTRLYPSANMQAVRKALGSFGLISDAHTSKMKALSGGQRARVVFAELFLLAPHVLLL